MAKKKVQKKKAAAKKVVKKAVKKAKKQAKKVAKKAAPKKAKKAAKKQAKSQVQPILSAAVSNVKAGGQKAKEVMKSLDKVTHDVAVAAEKKVDQAVASVTSAAKELSKKLK